MLQLFHDVSRDCSRIVAEKYSTSFCSAIRLLHKNLRAPIFNIYGFVRFADEIVDTFHDHDKEYLLNEFKKSSFEAIEKGISLNPILHSFQMTVNEYEIDHRLIAAFFHSMEQDLFKTRFSADEYGEYIYGSAEAVGLMCLKVFCHGNDEMYEKLRQPARALGAAFQKVNFLRDFKADNNELSRMYFPGCDFENFSLDDKKKIEEDIEKDFRQAYEGIIGLPVAARLGVYVAYRYYFSLFKKIKGMAPLHVVQKRVRVPDLQKLMIVFRAGIRHQLNLM